jgi:plasmid stabilization system protein ParE
MDITEDNETPEKPIVVTETCEKQLDEEVKYIEKNSPKQAEIMRSQFLNIVSKLRRQPKLGRSFKNGMRRIRLGKFRYNIYYIEFKEYTSIRGIWHTSRGTEFSED